MFLYYYCYENTTKPSVKVRRSHPLFYLNKLSNVLVKLSEQSNCSRVNYLQQNHFTKYPVQSFRHCVTTSVRHCVTKSVRHSVTTSVRECVAKSLCHYVTKSACHSVTKSIGHSVLFVRKFCIVPLKWAFFLTFCVFGCHSVPKSVGHSVPKLAILCLSQSVIL